MRDAQNPYYQFYDQQETYLARCKIKEQRRLNLFEDDMDDIEEDLGEPAMPETSEVEDEAVNDSDEECEDEMEIAVEQEEQDIENDPVRRQHFNYNEYSALVNGHPELFLDSDGNQVTSLDFAPGEGKRPTGFLYQKDWDHKSWPTLLPDGKFGLDHKRKVKLTRQNYFQQRILNVDDRFAKTPSYMFGAMSLVEAERLRNNANLTGMKGRRTVGADGQITYQLEDPCAVFDKVKGTPKYWQRAKYEIIAKLENIGPFHCGTSTSSSPSPPATKGGAPTSRQFWRNWVVRFTTMSIPTEKKTSQWRSGKATTSWRCPGNNISETTSTRTCTS